MVEGFDNVLAIIPARSGSKRIPGKNKAIMNAGKNTIGPLWKHKVNTAISAGLTKIIVSTDDEQILAEKETEFEATGVIILKRSEKNSQDTTMMDDVHHEVIHETEKMGMKYETICQLQPSSPLLKASTLKHALIQFKSRSLPCLVAVNILLKPCGAFYIFNKNEFMIKRTVWMPGLGIYILKELSEAIDIDDIWDLRIAESVLGGNII